jgi:hypothetical protein
LAWLHEGPVDRGRSWVADVSTAAGTVYTSATPIGAITSRPIAGRAARVATLTLDVAGVPGTYTLTLTNGTWYAAAASEQGSMQAGPAFEIRVGG